MSPRCWAHGTREGKGDRILAPVLEVLQFAGAAPMAAEGLHRIIAVCVVLPAWSPSIHGSADAMKLVSLPVLLMHIPRDQAPGAWETVSPLCLCSELFCREVFLVGKGSHLGLL